MLASPLSWQLIRHSLLCAVSPASGLSISVLYVLWKLAGFDFTLVHVQPAGLTFQIPVTSFFSAADLHNWSPELPEWVSGWFPRAYTVGLVEQTGRPELFSPDCDCELSVNSSPGVNAEYEFEPVWYITSLNEDQRAAFFFEFADWVRIPQFVTFAFAFAALSYAFLSGQVVHQSRRAIAWSTTVPAYHDDGIGSRALWVLSLFFSADDVAGFAGSMIADVSEEYDAALAGGDTKRARAIKRQMVVSLIQAGITHAWHRIIDRIFPPLG